MALFGAVLAQFALMTTLGAVGCRRIETKGHETQANPLLAQLHPDDLFPLACLKRLDPPGQIEESSSFVLQRDIIPVQAYDQFRPSLPGVPNRLSSAIPSVGHHNVAFGYGEEAQALSRVLSGEHHLHETPFSQVVSHMQTAVVSLLVPGAQITSINKHHSDPFSASQTLILDMRNQYFLQQPQQTESGLPHPFGPTAIPIPTHPQTRCPSPQLSERGQTQRVCQQSS